MFTGIIETLGTIRQIWQEGSNTHLAIAAPISHELRIDQSLSHNGVCLTVVDVKDNVHTVTAVEETLIRTNLGQLQVGDKVNLERAMQANARLDGHWVQGHVDTTVRCVDIKAVDGSWYYRFSSVAEQAHLVVDKGSICINGVSLTVVDPTENHFSVAIIPYTYEHTTFHALQVGNLVNIEFDILGKYVAKYLGKLEMSN